MAGDPGHRQPTNVRCPPVRTALCDSEAAGLLAIRLLQSVGEMSVFEASDQKDLLLRRLVDVASVHNVGPSPGLPFWHSLD
jgi:hypothetical protein